MRRIGAMAIAVVLASLAAFGNEQSEHLEHLREMLAALSRHGVVIPQPESVEATAATTISVTARSFSFTPSSFAVNQGDVVTITVSVPSNDASSIGHGILMDTYIPNGVNVGRGQTKSVTFTATMAGTFAFICTQPSCGSGHSSMIGNMIVNAVLNPAPLVSTISPNSGPTTGGTTVVISGANFQTSGMTSVKFDTTAVTNVNVASSTSISVITPAHAAATVSVTVTNPDGRSTTLSNAFAYTNPRPSITSVTPNGGSTAGGTAITITGSGFQNGASVTIGGVPATNVTVVNSTSINVVTPAHAAGTVSVTVTNPDSQSATLSNGFNYTNPGPSVNLVTPNSGSTAGGTAITITGSGFQNGAGVTIGGVPATNVTVVNSTTITATTPLGPANEQATIPKDVVVTNPDGTSATRTGAFTYFVPPLTVDSISPSIGNAGGGTVVTIIGTGFTTTVESLVTFGGVAASNVSIADAVTMQATAPAHAAGTVDIVVTLGNSSITKASAFTYQNSRSRRRAARH